MDKCLIRLTRMRWYMYRRPEVGVLILKQIAEDISNLLHYRMVVNWGILMKKRGVRRSQSLPVFGTSPTEYEFQSPSSHGHRHDPKPGVEECGKY